MGTGVHARPAKPSFCAFALCACVGRRHTYAEGRRSSVSKHSIMETYHAFPVRSRKQGQLSAHQQFTRVALNKPSGNCCSRELMPNALENPLVLKSK